jgi:hypothetical protein
MFQLTFVFFFVLVGSVIICTFTGNIEAIKIVDQQFEDPRLKVKRKDPFLIVIVKDFPIIIGIITALGFFLIGANLFDEIDLPQMVVLALIPLITAALVSWLSARVINRWVLPPIYAHYHMDPSK